MKTHTLYDGPTKNRHPVARIMIRCAAAMVISVFSLAVATAADLIGTVRRSGSPVAGVIVSLVPDNQAAADQEKSTTTNQAGRYAISGVVPGRYSLICKEGEHESRKQVDIDLAINRHDCDL